MDKKFNYWEECISEAFEEAKLKATPEQIDIVASWVEGAHENYGMAHGHDCIPNPLQLENEKLKKELKKEQDKTVCKACNGRGRIISNFGTRSSDSQCDKCRGYGKV